MNVDDILANPHTATELPPHRPLCFDLSHVITPMAPRHHTNRESKKGASDD